MAPRSWRRWRWVAAGVGSVVIAVWTYRALADPWPSRLVLGSSEGEVSLAFSPGGDLFVTSPGLGMINLWDCGTGRRRATWTIPGGGVAVEGAYSPDGATFAAIIRDNHVPARLVLIDVATGQVRASTPTRHDRNAGLAYVADGSAILFGSASGSGIQEVVVFDPAAGREVAATRPTPPLAGSAVGLSADARSLGYFPQRGGPITLGWADPGPSRPPVVASPTAAKATGAFDRSPDGRQFALGRLDGMIEIWDLPTGRLVATFRIHAGGNASAAIRFDPDGRTLWSRGLLLNPTGGVPLVMHLLDDLRKRLDDSGEREDMVLLDVATGRVLARSTDSRVLHFSPDGRTVASRDRDERIRIRTIPQP